MRQYDMQIDLINQSKIKLLDDYSQLQVDNQKLKDTNIKQKLDFENQLQDLKDQHTLQIEEINKSQIM